MRKLLSQFQGDKAIWAYVILLALFSFMPVFSASTNLVHVVGTGSIIGLLFKHFGHIFVGIVIIFFVHRIPFDRLKFIAPIAWIPVTALLVITSLQGMMIGGANASRWLKIPLLNISFQPSSLGWIALIAYVSWFLWRFADEKYTFGWSLLWLGVPMAFIVGPILPSNLSTAAIILFTIALLLFVGKYPTKYMAKIIAAGAIMIVFAIGMFKAFPDLAPSRYKTWEARFSRFGSEDKDEDRYQIENAKIAIAQGQMFGVGPGKSVQKNFLPQSSSDFIYAIIVEEFGFLGGITILIVYVLLLLRFLVVSNRAPNLFGKYLAFGLGFSIVFQAFINMGVAVEIFPTTGQPLPLVSSGGTSIWMTCVSLGIILSISRKEDQVKAQLADQERKQEEFKRILEEQQLGEDATLDKDSEDNPIFAVLKK
ncbi:FtsW/RodA/SpoVE family cell cycle protein [Flavobacterium sp. xlx-214]|uniref:FtsW/RodA/SpoVE family cell cycle protein n=1 Tax=unclassified Flavobacterium TaxID=196869 RepID=UPI0013D6BF7F|nr:MULTISPECIES: FtsW/RodA/SpoVE family cell cycle protein [unclassified Flavobacterium]MBA5791930.1 FtsW/RodA/SpoVE family cell cycle protein [Flavobacterium sp. xlx-221]QMI84186.1 FtsW/RodA/SpoVE family cell cycle protein [Flavobacterium sp. xlx-214]